VPLFPFFVINLAVGLLVIGFGANLLVKPVDARFHEPRPDRVRSEEPAMEA